MDLDHQRIELGARLNRCWYVGRVERVVQDGKLVLYGLDTDLLVEFEAVNGELALLLGLLQQGLEMVGLTLGRLELSADCSSSCETPASRVDIVWRSWSSRSASACDSS